MLALCIHLLCKLRDTNGQKSLPKFDTLVYVNLLLTFLLRIFFFFSIHRLQPTPPGITKSVGLAPGDGKEFRKKVGAGKGFQPEV